MRESINITTGGVDKPTGCLTVFDKRDLWSFMIEACTQLIDMDLPTCSHPEYKDALLWMTELTGLVTARYIDRVMERE